MTHQPQAPDSFAPAPAPAPRRRTALVAVITLVTLSIVAGGAFAAMRLLKGGPRAEQALPASVLGVVTLDLDPTAGQKVEGIKTLRKFKAFRELADVKDGDDLRKRLFEEALKDCEGVSYARDVEPWIGDNAGAALMTFSGKPAPLLAIAVDDEDKAKAGVKKILACGDDDATGVAFVNGFAVISDSQAHADKAAAAAADASLADDAAYQKWSGKAGERGIVNFYLAKKAAKFLRDEAGNLGGGLEDGLGGALTGGTATATAGTPGKGTDPFASFEGAAGSLRFADGGLELEVVGDAVPGSSSAVAGELVGRLPADTAAALGISVPEDYAERVVDQLDLLGLPGGEQLGLDLPDDLRDLLGKGLAISVGGTPPADLRTLDPAELPAGITISGDEDRIAAVVDKILATAGGDASGLVVDSTDGRVTLALDPEYAAQLKKGGKLGDDKTFRSVVPEADKAAFVFYADLDSSWRDSIAATLSGAEKKDFLANTEPLAAVGMSGWKDGSESRFLLKVTTD